MASAFFLYEQFEEVLVYLNSIRSFFVSDDVFNYNYAQVWRPISLALPTSIAGLGLIGILGAQLKKEFASGTFLDVTIHVKFCNRLAMVSS